MLGRVGRTDLIWINHDELQRALPSAIGRLVPVRGRGPRRKSGDVRGKAA